MFGTIIYTSICKNNTSLLWKIIQKAKKNTTEITNRNKFTQKNLENPVVNNHANYITIVNTIMQITSTQS